MPERPEKSISVYWLSVRRLVARSHSKLHHADLRQTE